MPAPDLDRQQEAAARQQQLTKPPGSLGRLEQVAIRLAAIQGQARPQPDPVVITVFAGDHGVVREGVSAFPQAVTGQMMANFTAGGAAISVLSRHLGAHLEVVNTGTQVNPEKLPGVLHHPIARQTGNLLREPAMDEAQWHTALELGRDAVRRALDRGTRLFIGGEMGIGNTTAATAILCALLELAPAQLAGPGTGLDATGLQHKIRVLEQALEQHKAQLTDAAAISRILGGFEICALSGAYLAAAQAGLATLVDGFICTAAAAVALRLNPSVAPYLLFSHCSAEPGHRLVLTRLQAEPLVDLNLRLGEGSGAAVAVPLLRAACQLHNQMATFTEAAVSQQTQHSSL